MDGALDLPKWLFQALALCLPCLLLVFHRGSGHQGDLAFFFDWYRSFAESPAFYRDGPGINYPILGVLWLCLPARIMESLFGEPITFETYRDLIKLTLTTAEVLSIFVIRWLASALGISRPRIVALALYSLPSTWAIGAWFGQIDVIGTLLLLVAAAGAARYGVSGSRSMLLVSLVGLHGAILTKQLTYFSIPGLAALLGFALYLQMHRADRPTGWVLAAVCASPLVWFVTDPFLALPDGYTTHLGWILTGGGSSHGDVVCASGANLWTLLYPGNPRSSVDTLLAGVSLKTWGIALYAIVQVFFIVAFVHETKRSRGLESGPLTTVMAYGIFLVGASNLAMAVLLTGVHERYLVHGVPFLVLGLLYFARDGVHWRVALAGSVIVGAWSGLFVLSTIHWQVFTDIALLTPFASTAIMSVLQIVLLTTLLAVCTFRLVEKTDVTTL